MALCNGSCTSGVTVATSSSTAVPCAARERLQEALLTYFQHAEFRPGQLESSTLPALHRKDVFVRMATVSGKSLCMFLVPLSHSSTAMGIIISPLKALMEQQVMIPEKEPIPLNLLKNRSSSCVKLGSLQFVLDLYAVLMILQVESIDLVCSYLV